jgi:membrane protein
MNGRQNAYWMLNCFSGFLRQVLLRFRRNQGLLLSGAVAYYTLLSIVPMSILSLVLLTHFIDEQQLILTLSTYLNMVIPSYAGLLIKHVQAFIEHRRVVGIIGILVMLFFSSLAFAMLENAMSVIFFQKVRASRRSFFLSAIIPYVYVFVMGLGIVLASIIVSIIETVENLQLIFLGWSLNLGGTPGVTLYILGIVGEALLLTSFYLVMPVVRVRFRHALAGGISAAVLWEITRRVLVWYYTTVSMVNVIYGSLATIVVALLSIEAVALILLLGAQVIAELERNPEGTEGDEPSGFET